MNKLQRIQYFLIDYHTKSDSIKTITKSCYDYYQELLIKEYLKIAKHPYPTEYVEYLETS